MPSLGTITDIRRYPLKSMQGESLKQCTIGPGGLVGDRAWALRDVQTGKTCSAKHHWKLLMCAARYLEDPAENAIAHIEMTLPDGSTCCSNQSDTADKLSKYLEREVTLLPPQPTGNYFDLATFHLLTTASIDALRALLPESNIDLRRFRPNILLQTPPNVSGFVDFQWIGSALHVGGVVMHADAPVQRCGMTSSPQPNLPKDPQVISTLINETEKKLGIYLSTQRTGTIRVGNTIATIES